MAVTGMLSKFTTRPNFCIAICDRGLQSLDGQGLGMERPADLEKDDDEFDAYRKRMMLAYRFRPNPLVTFAVTA